MKNITLALWLVFVCATNSFSLSLIEMKQLLLQNPPNKNVEFTMKTVLQMKGIQTETMTSVLQKGEDKFRMDVDNSFAKQRIIRNGSLIWVKDLKTGQIHRQDQPNMVAYKSELGFLDSLDSEHFEVPVKVSDNKWAVNSKDRSETGLSFLSFIYDADLNQIVELNHLTPEGVKSKTQMTYENVGSVLNPKTIRVTSGEGAAQVLVVMEYLQFKRPTEISDDYFQMN